MRISGIGCTAVCIPPVGLSLIFGDRFPGIAVGWCFLLLANFDFRKDLVVRTVYFLISYCFRIFQVRVFVSWISWSCGYFCDGGGGLLGHSGRGELHCWMGCLRYYCYCMGYYCSKITPLSYCCFVSLMIEHLPLKIILINITRIFNFQIIIKQILFH